MITVGGIRLYISPLFVCLAVFCAISGNIASLLTYLLCVALHETAHGIMGMLLGCRIDGAELMPYGCRMNISGISSFFDELMIALAGPVSSLAAYISCRGGNGFIYEFAIANLYIALVNLLPVYPLDSGRIMGALMKLLDVRPGYRLKTALSALAGAAMISLGIYKANITFVIFGIFILYSGITVKKQTPAADHLRLMETISKARGAAVRHVAINVDSTIANALMFARGNRYTVFLILSNDMTELCRIDQTRMMELGAMFGSGCVIRDAIEE